ncbi:MAG TPA: DUF4340 domain-containing protein [Burkholderiales bacterium]|nr:DUF4340 domain-containing protein [Burkholderiales bacterium]
MNRKQTIVLLLLVLVIGGIGLAVYFQDRAAWKPGDTGAGRRFMAALDVNAVAQIHLKQGKAEVTLIKQDAGWTIKERGGFPADYAQVADFLLKVRDLKVAQTEAIAVAQRPRLDLADPGADKGAGMLLEFKDKSGKPMQTLILGRKHFGPPPVPVPGQKGAPDGRYLLTAPDATEYVLTTEPLNLAEPGADKWLAKDFVRIDRVSSIAVTPPSAAGWTISRKDESGEWQLAGAKPGEKLDFNKSLGAVNTLYSPAFVDVAVDPDAATLGLDKPATAEIETFDGLKYQLKFGRKAGDDAHYAFTFSVDGSIVGTRTPGKDEKPEEKKKLDDAFQKKLKELEERFKREQALAKWTFIVERKPFDALLRERAEMLEQKKPGPDEKMGAKAGAKSGAKAAGK